MMRLPFEQFPALSAIKICRHAFTQRIPGIDVSHDKAEVLKRLDAAHRGIRDAIGIGDWPLFTAQQIHGNKIAIVDNCSRGPVGREFPGCDGIITNQRGVVLGVYVADCCAVYIVDSKTPAIGLVHSGCKGTELGVVTNAIRQMMDRFGSNPDNMIAQFSPCIRPPHYEVDFAAEILRQCRELGVTEIHDSGVCTACKLDRYYSYRAEKGKTGRMLALLGLNPTMAK
ncbi:MAG TPA: polyphenol oxidase family protein [Candidatus Binatia bacterium]|nr:polyphenol oxidase family protein [Candidatus Binatia bacterium]